jgi:hypothetical protein
MMRLRFLFAIGLGLVFPTGQVEAQTNVVTEAPALPQQPSNQPTTNYLGRFTNGPAVMELCSITTTTMITNRFLPRRLATNSAVAGVYPSYPSVFRYTNAIFHEFQPESLSHTIWTNFLASTNGRDLRVWSVRTHPANWPTNPPVANWNTNSVIWGMKGLTALSPCWQGEVNSGQVPLTALTRRHVYTRGHHLGEEGLNSRYAGFKAWFVTANNLVVEVRIKRMIVRASMGANGVYRDYTIMLLDRDLPDSIQPIRVTTVAEVQSKYPVATQGLAPHPIFGTEQGGSVSTGVAPLVVNNWKGGDSGSPNLLPLPGELIFFSGRSTTGPTPEMQADMDELCRTEKLNPKDYQLRWVDLSQYPSY